MSIDQTNVVRIPQRELRCVGVGRDAENDKALCFYFSRPVTDDEMWFLHEVMQRAVYLTPDASKPRMDGASTN